MKAEAIREIMAVMREMGLGDQIYSMDPPKPPKKEKKQQQQRKRSPSDRRGEAAAGKPLAANDGDMLTEKQCKLISAIINAAPGDVTNEKRISVRPQPLSSLGAPAPKPG